LTGLTQDKDEIRQVLNYFRAARVRIQVCVQRLSYEPLRRILMAKKRQGLLVQIIVDHDVYSDQRGRNDVLDRLLADGKVFLLSLALKYMRN